MQFEGEILGGCLSLMILTTLTTQMLNIKKPQAFPDLSDPRKEKILLETS